MAYKPESVEEMKQILEDEISLATKAQLVEIAEDVFDLDWGYTFNYEKQKWEED